MIKAIRNFIRDLLLLICAMAIAFGVGMAYQEEQQLREKKGFDTRIKKYQYPGRDYKDYGKDVMVRGIGY